MKKNNGLFSSDRTDRALVALSLISLLFCAVVLTSETIFQFLLGHTSGNSNAPVIGEISFAKNDIRHRSEESLSWEKAKQEQRIRTGDSVFTGEKSQSQVILKDGGRVDLDQNSLVKFAKIDNIELPNLALGNFRIAVNGTMKIAIDGEVTEIKGLGTEIQVILKDREKPKLRLLKGSAQVKTKNTTKTLATNQITVIREPAVAVKKEPIPVVEEKVLPQPVNQLLIHTDLLYDLFEVSAGALVRREQRRLLLPFPLDIAWTTEGRPAQVFGQLSASPNFSNIPESFAQSADRKTARFTRSLLGTNFYRLSVDGKSWSQPATFEIEAKPLDTPAPQLKLKSSKLIILQKSADLLGQIYGDFPNFVLEMSHSPEFPVSATRVHWLKSKKFSFPISQAKSIFMRVRGVNSKLNLTDTSDSIRVNVEKPELPEAPYLTQPELHLTEGDKVILPWPSALRAKLYQAQIIDNTGRIITRLRTGRRSMTFLASKTGEFRLKITGEDAFGRISQKSSQMRLLVRAKPKSIIAKKELPKRKPASSGTLTQQLTTEIPDYLNRNYPSSKLSLEGAAFTMYSQDQLAQGQTKPTALMMGIRWLKWSGSQGFEASLKTKMVDVSESSGGAVSPLQLEGRYHYRWTLPFNPFSKFDQSQVSLIGGYEYYRNPGGALFSPGYDLFKAGFSLAFPLWRRWDTGGEVLYGHGLESSSKYEVSGYIHYYVRKHWSFGFGYRVHLFEAGSNAASPLGMPYREGFGEGYSVLRWHY